MRTRNFGFGMMVIAAIGCGDHTAGGPTGTGASATMMVTASTGGTVMLEGTSLEVPAGALPADTAITITSTTGTPPSTFTSWSSPVFKFEPDGLVFLVPVTVSLSFTGAPSRPAVHWSTSTGGFENLGGVVAGGRISTSVTHFSEGFVAEDPVPNDGGVVLIDSQIQDGPSRPNDGATPLPDSGSSPDAGVPIDGGEVRPDSGATCNFNGVCDPGEDLACPDCNGAPFDGGIAIPDGGSGTCSPNGVCDPDEDPTCADCAKTCNHNGVCDPGEDLACADCNVAPVDGGVPTADGGAGTCNPNGVCDPGEDPACPDCASSGTCNHNDVCDPGEDPACADCAKTCNHNGVCEQGEDLACADCNAVPGDGGVWAPDGGSATCNPNGACDPGEDPACPDCASGGTCNHNDVCDPGEDPACADCNAVPGDGGVWNPDGGSGTCNPNGACDPGEDPACPDCATSACNRNGVCDPGEDPACTDCGDGMPVDGGVPNFDGGSPSGGGPLGAGFHLLGAYSTGSSEAVNTVDPITGTGSPRGNFSGLFGYAGQFRVAADNLHAYALGDDSSFTPRLWTLDLTTGGSTSISVAQNLFMGAATDQGDILIASWNGIAEEVSRMNPQTGATTAVGSFGGLWGWQGQMALNRVSNELYAIGQSCDMCSYTLYKLDLSTGTGSSVGVAQSYTLGGVRSDGFVIASYWNGSSQRVVALNPATGGATDLGALGLVTWYSSMTFDPDANKVYAFGYPDELSTTARLYWLNVSSGDSGSVSVSQRYYAGRY